MEIIVALLGSGLLAMLIAMLIREGAHRKEHENIVVHFKTIHEDMDKKEMKICKNAEDIHEQQVTSATILVSLDYIKVAVDELRGKSVGR